MTDVAVTREGPAATLTLSRPERRNALDPSLLRALAAAVDDVSDDDDVRVVVLTGAGSAFSAGADIGWMRTSRELGHERNLEDAVAMAQAFDTLDRCPKAVVARVNGPAIGGGAGLVACADVAVASGRARFAFAEVRLGILPASIAPFVLRKIGPGRARELFTTGRSFDAAEAETYGLVHHVVSADRLDATVDEVVRTFLRPPSRGCDQAARPRRHRRARAPRPPRPHRGGEGRRRRPGRRHRVPREAPAEMVELRRVLIANRGEIAVRIVRACREEGVSPVVAVTPGDRVGLPATLADAVAEVPSYLDASALARAATEASTDNAW